MLLNVFALHIYAHLWFLEYSKSPVRILWLWAPKPPVFVASNCINRSGLSGLCYGDCFPFFRLIFPNLQFNSSCDCNIKETRASSEAFSWRFSIWLIWSHLQFIGAGEIAYYTVVKFLIITDRFLRVVDFPFRRPRQRFITDSTFPNKSDSYIVAESIKVPKNSILVVAVITDWFWLVMEPKLGK